MSVAALSTRSTRSTLSLLDQAKAIVGTNEGFILDVASAFSRNAIWEDTARTIAASVDGPVGSIQDELERYYAEQATTTAKLLLRTDGTYYWLDNDGSDDNMSISLPNGLYSVLQRVNGGVLEYKVNITGGAISLYGDPRHQKDIYGLLVTSGPIDNTLREYAKSIGSGENLTGVTSVYRWFRQMGLVEVETAGFDTSSIVNFSDCFMGNHLTTLDVSNWDTSSALSFASFVNGCSSLTTIITEGGTGNPFADSPCTSYNGAFTNTNLTQQTIDNILVRINAANTSNGTFTQSGGSAPSTVGQAAIDALRLRGWTVTVTGGY